MSLFSIIKIYLRTFTNIKKYDEEESGLLFKVSGKKLYCDLKTWDVERLSGKTRLRRDYSCTCVNEVNSIIRQREKRKRLSFQSFLREFTTENFHKYHAKREDVEKQFVFTFADASHFNCCWGFLHMSCGEKFEWNKPTITCQGKYYQICVVHELIFKLIFPLKKVFEKFLLC